MKDSGCINLLISSMLAKNQLLNGKPCFWWYWWRNSAFNLLMSTAEGHSFKQAWQDRHNSMTLYNSGEVIPVEPNLPLIAARRVFALPLVLWVSSLVAWKVGHITPPSSWRQTPAPLHISTARSNPSSSLKLSMVSLG